MSVYRPDFPFISQHVDNAGIQIDHWLIYITHIISINSRKVKVNENVRGLYSTNESETFLYNVILFNMFLCMFQPMYRTLFLLYYFLSV